MTDFIGRRLSPGVKWSGDHSSWQQAAALSTGYSQESILERVQAAALQVKNGQAPAERDGVVLDRPDYSWPVLAALTWIAAQNGGRLDVLDYGGSLGTSYRQSRPFLEALRVTWSIVEQPHFVEAGRANFSDERLGFYRSIEECLAERSPNVVLLSSVLQYLERPYDLIDDLKAFPFVIIDRTPMHRQERDRLTVQEVPPSIYPARYPCWLFSENRLRATLGRHFRVVADFGSHLGGEIRCDEIEAQLRGFILQRH